MKTAVAADPAPRSPLYVVVLEDVIEAVGKLLETEDSSSFGMSFNEEAIEALREAHGRAKAAAADRMGRASG